MGLRGTIRSGTVLAVGVEAGQSADGNSGGEAGVRRHLRLLPMSHQAGQQKLLSRVYRPALPGLPLSPQSPITEFSRLNAFPHRRQLRERGEDQPRLCRLSLGGKRGVAGTPFQRPRDTTLLRFARVTKLAAQEPPPVRHPTTNHSAAAANSACCWLQLFGRICTGGKYFTPYELLSAGPVLSSEEIDRLFTALRGRGAAETGRLTGEGERGGGVAVPARSPIRSFVTSNRQFTMREFFQFIHSAVTAVFYLGSTSSQTPPLSTPLPAAIPAPDYCLAMWGCKEVNRGRVLILLFTLVFLSPRGRRR